MYICKQRTPLTSFYRTQQWLVSFFQRGDMSEDDVRACGLVPAVIRRSSNTAPAPKQEFRVCLFERETLEPVRVRGTTGQPAFWGTQYEQLSELAQSAEQGGAANIQRAASPRVFLRSGLWHDAVLAWVTEAQEKFDKIKIFHEYAPTC